MNNKEETMNSMRALVYTGTREVEYRDADFPSPGPGEALVKIDAVGICGSDMHAYHGHDARRVPPMILGHEATGIVEHGRLRGKRVTMNPIAFCGYCEYCLSGRQNLCANRTMIGMSRPGAFAQYLTIPEQSLIELPDDMDPVAAALTEPTATALHAVHRAMRVSERPLAEARAMVIGAGSIGLLIALLLKHYGCRDILIGDTNALRRQTATEADCGEVFDPSASTPDENHYDLVFDAVGAVATRKTAIDSIRPGGVIVHVGLLQGDGDFNVRKLTLAEVTFIGVYTYSQTDLKAAAQALYTGALGPLNWVSTQPLSEGSAAFQALHDGSTPSAKIVLIP
jgi:alcohol dehydrogenase